MAVINKQKRLTKLVRIEVGTFRKLKRLADEKSLTLSKSLDFVIGQYSDKKINVGADTQVKRNKRKNSGQ